MFLVSKHFPERSDSWINECTCIILGTPCLIIEMARIARVVALGFPHHITQRGNRRQATFFSDDDYRTYITLIAE